MLCFACLLLILAFFFCFFVLAVYLDIRCTTRNDVLEAMEKTRNNYPEANFNPLTNEKGIILPTENPPSDKAVDYTDTEDKQNDASLDCLLRNATEGHYIKYLLQPTGKKYVTTDWTMDLCVYESIVNSLYSTISQDEHLLKNYTGPDLKYQMLVYILENYYKDEKLRDVLNNHMAEIFLLGGSLCTWVEKMMKTITWGDLELINVISLILKLKISILDFGGGTTNIVTWHFGNQKSIKTVDMVLLYNGSTHFTGTGNTHIASRGTCNSFHTALFLFYFFYAPNSIELYRTIFNHNYKLFKLFRTLSNML